MTAPKRRWFRFSLATLFVVMTVLCVLLFISTLEPVRRLYFGFSQDDLKRIEGFPEHIPLMKGESIVGIEYVGNGKANIVTSPPSDPLIRHKLRVRRLNNGA